MSIEITVKDPANTPRKELALVIEVLQRFHDAQGATRAETRLPSLPLAHADHPSAGVEIVSPEQAFAAAAGNPTAAFAGNDPTPSAAFAPSTAGAETPETAPEATPGTSAAPSAPVPPAPSAPNAGTPAAAPTAPPAPGVERDSEGMPWDARIHASGKDGPVKIANGTWRKKRGVDDAVVAQITAELRQAMAAPVASPNVPPAPPPTFAGGAAATIPTAPDGAPAPSAPPSPAPAAPTAIAPGVTFVGLAAKVGAWINAGKLTQEEIAAACAQHGIPNLPALMTRPDLVPAVAESLEAVVLMKG